MGHFHKIEKARAGTLALSKTSARAARIGSGAKLAPVADPVKSELARYIARPAEDGTWFFLTAYGSSSGYRSDAVCNRLAKITLKQDREAWLTGGSPYAKQLSEYFNGSVGGAS